MSSGEQESEIQPHLHECDEEISAFINPDEDSMEVDLPGRDDDQESKC